MIYIIFEKKDINLLQKHILFYLKRLICKSYV